MERVPENIDAMRELLQYGLRGTDLEALIAIGKQEDSGRYSCILDYICNYSIICTVSLWLKDVLHRYKSLSIYV